MKRLHLANIILICVLGTLLLWPKIKPSKAHNTIQKSYSSVCMITTNNAAASGVLLESGYILTAAHVVDQNLNGILEENEIRQKVVFPSIDFETTATVIISGNIKESIDLAVLVPEKEIPLRGVRIIQSKDYWDLKFGEPITTIGMQMGESPAHITDGRLISMPSDDTLHRNSANSYFGNSGGGIFKEEQLIGIAVAVGRDKLHLNMPIFDGPRFIGTIKVGYMIPLANSSLHVPAPLIVNFLQQNDLDKVLETSPGDCPYHAYFAVMIFNGLLMSWLIIIYNIIRYWMKR